MFAGVYVKSCGGQWFLAGKQQAQIKCRRPTEGINICILVSCESRMVGEFSGSWSAPPGLPSIQTFQNHAGSYLCSLLWAYLVCDRTRYLPYTSWLQVLKGTVVSFNVDGMLVRSCAAMQIGIIKSTVEQDMPGLRYIARECFKE